ncbi:MAG: DUF2314 domain-containing protein, partial [Bacteroidota bacterium]
FFLSSLSIIAQNDTEMTSALSEIGLYTMDSKLNEKTIKRELKAIFPNVTFVDEAPDMIDDTIIFLDPIADVAEDYPAHEMEYLDYFASELTKTQKEELSNSKNALVCVVYYPKKDAFSHTKKLYDWVYKTTKGTNFIVYDGEVRDYFSPEEWKKNRVDAWENGIPNALQQITLSSYRQREYCRSITYGMQRFGLPDILIEESPCTFVSSASQVLAIVSQLLLEGTQIENKRMIVDLDAVQNSNFQRIIPELITDDAQKKAVITFETSVPMEDGDPFNTIYKIDFTNKDYKNSQAYESAIYDQLFGVDDEVTHVSHNDEIQAASARAKKRLPALKELFNEGLEGDKLLLKAPFITDSGGNEWMWVEVTRWDDESIEGILQNKPYYIKDLKSGSEVTVQQADVFDYILYKADGTEEGNETGKLIQKYGN